MASTVTAVTCAAAAWTLISEANVSVAFEWRSETGYGKWHIGQTEPDVDTIHYKTLRPKSPQSLNDLSIADKVWAQPFGTDDLIMEVITP